MKRLFKYAFVNFFLAFSFMIMFSNDNVGAKKSISEVFEVEVGDDKLHLLYMLERDSQKNVQEKIALPVILKGVGEDGESYRWEHTFCYKVSGGEELCELDKTGLDQEENGQDILDNQTYSFSFWDDSMPYYSEELVFEYMRFSNKFVKLDGNNDEIVLDDILFTQEEIDYTYSFGVAIEEREYINSTNTSATLVNNISSSLFLVGAPEYKFINEVCVEEDNCDVFETEKVYSNNVGYAITPYIGNINFSYNNSYFVSSEVVYDEVTFRTSLQCIKNCDSRRIISEKIVVYDNTFAFDYILPQVDEANTVISSTEEYVKSVNIKITANDDMSGINEDNLIYQLIRPNYGYCSLGGTSVTNSYQNGIGFTLGPDLVDGPYCFRYQVSDNSGNYFVSDYYIFYFDNSGPNVVVDKDGYIESNYYNKVELEVSLADYSAMGEIYYLWSNIELSEEDYLIIKTDGVLYDNNELISSNNITIDGAYSLYILAYDKLGNYTFYNGGIYNIDVTALVVEDISVEVNNMDSYRANGTIKVNIAEMANEEEFTCGFFSEEKEVTLGDLNYICKNNKNIAVPSNLEGKYSLWVNVHDRASNYSVLEVSKDLFIDTMAPRVGYDVLKEDDRYYITNEITLNTTDLNGANSLKYGWLIASKTNVTSNDLTSSFENGETIGYPKGYYGEYKLYVSVIDNLGNERFMSLDKIFKIDTDIIRISLVGKENITIIRGQNYIEEGAKAFKGDVSSGGRVSEISVEGKVDNNKAGVYYVTYSSGEGDLLVSVTRKVVVKSDKPYLLTVGSLFVLGSIVLIFRMFIKRKKEVDQ